ncbi:MAG TPA: uracil-DNA glycosylase [Bacteroidales bacterium]|nr:uracil-DNA glycosylase [Bacteroidales bacterium]
MEINNLKYIPDWEPIIGKELKKPYFKELASFVSAEQAQFTVYPPDELIFNAFAKTGFNTVKVVILGQDPYHGAGQAHGLSFSVSRNIAVPRSLKNIYKEIHNDLGIPVSTHGNLEKWAQQGVLLLNTVLTVRAGTPKSHQGKGWEVFTDAVIRNLSETKNHLVFMLWGADAFKKAELIDTKKHLVLKAAHPSPFSAARGFFGCKHFSKANEYLVSFNLEAIDWAVE